MTFKELAEKWWALYAVTLGKGTQRNRATALDNHLIPKWGSRVVNTLTIEEVEEWHIGAGLPKAMQPQKALKQILNWGLVRGYINHNPARTLRLAQSASSSWTYLTRDEANQLLAASQGYPEYSLFMVAIYMGLRIGELCALDQKHVDLDRNVLHVCCHMDEGTGEVQPGTKGSRPELGIIKQRTLGIPDVLRPVFVQLLQQPAEHLWSNTIGTRIRHKPARISLRAALERASLRHIRFHDLRHTFASHWMMSGGKLAELRDWMGHASITITERYTHLSAEHLQASRNTIDLGVDGLSVVSL